MSVQFEDIARRALDRAPELLQNWLGGKKRGSEWVGERRANGGLGDSWSVNLANGCWLHGAGDERGGDLVSLYAALNKIDQLAALHEVARILGSEPVPAAPPVERPAEQPLMPVEPIPADAPPMPVHPKLGQPSAVYSYGSAFRVLRFDLPDGKQFSQMTWRGGKWSFKGYPAPRPLYNLDALQDRNGAPVLVVEGEKTADAAAKVLGTYVVITWAGGSSTVSKTDWAPLAGREIVIWPDADDPGWKAAADIAKLANKAGVKSVKVIDTHGQPEGWDLADAIADGWDAPLIIGWAKEHLVKTKEAEPPPPIKKYDPHEDDYDIVRHNYEAAQPPAEPPPQDVAVSEPAIVSYQNLGLDCNEGGSPHSTVANCSLIIQAHNDLKGKIWLDTFRMRVYHTLDSDTPKEWTDTDDINLTVWMQHRMRMPKLTLSIVQQAVEHAANMNRRNSLTDWLDSLVWDGVPRLEDWLSDCIGVEKTAYSIAVARNWPISMVARAYRPGCQVDTMPVLEGRMGKGKSTFLEVLGGEWFSAIPVAFGDKDFLQGIQGQWLVEIPDMTGFSKREHTQILATITNRVDRYRSSYGRRAENHPRVAVFAATSETDDYLSDARGRRRYWPLRCSHLDLDVLKSQRDQIFAEAVHLYKNGAKWYEMPDAETDQEQLKRLSNDPWRAKIAHYVSGVLEVRMEAILSSSACLDLSLEKQTRREVMRCAAILRELGWVQAVTKEKGSRESVRIWRKKADHEVG